MHGLALIVIFFVAHAREPDLVTTCGKGRPRKMTDKDPINHPPHYHAGKIETIDVIEAWDLGFCLGNVVKYILRHRLKGDPLTDLQKARWYLDREIANLQRERTKSV